MAEKRHKDTSKELDILPRLPHLEVIVYLFTLRDGEWQNTQVLIPGALHLLRIVFPHIDEIEYLAEQAWEGLHQMGKEPTVLMHAWIHSTNWNLPAFTEFYRSLDEHETPWYIADLFFTPPAQPEAGDREKLSIDIFLNHYYLSQFREGHGTSSLEERLLEGMLD